MPGKQILVLGGISDGTAFALLQHIVAQCQDVTFIRLADKHLLLPAAKVYLTFVDANTKAILEQGSQEGSKPAIECLQANFAASASRDKVFKPLTGPTFDYVFDLTGEPDFRALELVFVEKIARIGYQLGEVAAATKVKAYVRCVPSLFEVKDGKNKLLSEEDASVQPITLISKWHWEAARALADIPDLPLVVARPGLIYGKPVVNEFTGRLLIAEIYKFVNEDMQMLWTSDIPYHTLHAEDFASGIYHLAEWMAEVGQPKALEVAGSPLPPCRPVASHVRWLSGKKSQASDYDGEELDFLAMRSEQVKAPVFNLVDDSKTTMGQLAESIAKAVGVKHSFTNTIINQFAKLNMETVVEEANSHHLENWPLLLEKSNPPILNPVLTPEIPRELMAKHSIALDGSKIKRVTGWQLKHPRLTQEVVKVIHQSWQEEEGVWPMAAPLKK